MALCGFNEVFLTLAVSALVLQAFLLFLALFEPELPYRLSRRLDAEIDSPEFVRLLAVIGDSQAYRGTRVEVLTNGEAFYEAELEAIRAAQTSVHLEAYIFLSGEVTRRFLSVLTERAAAGVEVKLVIDAIGSFTMRNSRFRELRAAGGQIGWYHPMHWDTWPRINNRTHREILIVDGSVGFVGGAGFADHWLVPKGRRRRWRDTMFRVEGDTVAALESTFAENWLESSGELLAPAQLPERSTGEAVALVINSSPSGRSTRCRMVVQTLLACARDSIAITTPYFLPDRSAREEMVRAIRERGVRITVITPGRHHDHLLTRRSSRRLYGDLLRSGAEIYEYSPAMIHAKVMLIDGCWSLVGSANFDHRSFSLNDEVNLAVLDTAVAARLARDFARDVASSRRVTYAEWRRRALVERVSEWLGWVLERQQ